jgi:hypothetical protein
LQSSKSHRTQDGASVGNVISDATPAIGLIRWWAHRDKQQTRYAYVTSFSQDPIVAWQIEADGKLTPVSEDAWIAELGQLPFAYFVNQRNADSDLHRQVDRNLLRDPAALAFLPSADGDFSKSRSKKNGFTLNGLSGSSDAA